jgi:hypothetical protein
MPVRARRLSFAKQVRTAEPFSAREEVIGHAQLPDSFLLRDTLECAAAGFPLSGRRRFYREDNVVRIFAMLLSVACAVCLGALPANAQSNPVY